MYIMCIFIYLHLCMADLVRKVLSASQLKGDEDLWFFIHYFLLGNNIILKVKKKIESLSLNDSDYFLVSKPTDPSPFTKQP